MADLDLSISAQDRGARRLIDQLIRAMQQLRAAADKANAGRANIGSARATANALRQELLASQELTRQRIEAHKETKRMLAEEVAATRAASAQKIASLREENAKREALSGGRRDQQRQRVADARNAIREEIENQRKLVAAVRQAANEQVETQQRLRKVANDAARARVLDEQKRLNAFKATRDRQRREISQQIEIEKRIRDEQKSRLLSAPVGSERAKTIQRDIAFSRQIIRDLREQRRESIETNKERIDAQRGLVETEKANATAVRKIRAEAVKNAITQGRAEINTAKETATQSIASARVKLRSAQDELTTRQQNFRNLRQTGRDEVAAARASGAAAVAAARVKNSANIAAAATAVRSAQATVAAKKKETLAAEQAARAQERAAKQANNALRFQGAAMPGLIGLTRRLTSAVLQLVTAYAGFRSIKGFIDRGIEFNALIESSKLGIAALITAQADLIDQNGKLLQGTEALGAAQAIAGRQLDKLRIAGIQTAATTAELVQTFQETVGAGLNVGLTLDQIRKFSVLVAQAGQAINLPMNQLQQESRSILSSTIDRNSRLAKTLNITNAIVNQAKAEGKLFELLNDRFAAFNVAGIESIKTWTTLKSTIKDAFDLFAGMATEPLFESLKAAGQEAVGRIFDFDTAEIREGFKGMIEGLQSLFQGVGDVFATAIRKAVDQAEALSRWFRENREEVRLTAIAIGGMVESLTNMIGTIAQGVAEMVSFGNQINVVAGTANVLNAAFEAIGENIKLIMTLLASRVLITTFAAIAAAILGVGTITGGIAAALTLIVAAVVGADFVTKVFTKTQKEAAIEAARLGTALDDQRRRALPLLEQYAELSRQLEDQNISKEETVKINRRLEDTVDALIEIDSSYSAMLRDGTKDVKERRKALIDLLNTQQQEAALQEITIRERQEALKAEKQRLEQTLQTRFDPAKGRIISEAEARESELALGGVNEQLEIVGVQLDQATRKTDTLGKAFKRLSQDEATIRPRTPPPEEGGEPAFVKSARALLERVKAEIELEKSLAEADFARGIIDRTELNKRIHAAEVVEFLAEQNLINALRKKALADLAAAEKKKGAEGKKAADDANDRLAALLIQEQTIGAKRQKLDAESNQAILEDRRETVKKLEEINIAYLKATGNQLEAAQREIALESEDAIKDAIQELTGLPEGLKEALMEATGPKLRELIEKNINILGPIVQKVVFTADVESVKKQTDAISDIVTQAEENLRHEIELIRARFDAKAKKKGLTDQERQQQQIEIAQAHQRAAAAFADLELQLRLMKELATDKTIIAMLDAIIARMHIIIAGTEELNLLWEDFKRGAREVAESGLGDFLEGLGNKAESIGEQFKVMIKEIIDGLRRLLSQLIAKQIFAAILGPKAEGAAEGGKVAAKGGLAQRMMAGGIARPSHGVLHGGVPGRDSIPIMAMANEYFVKRKATQYYGADFLDLINQMRLPLSWSREAFSLMKNHWTPRPIRDRRYFAQGGAVGDRGGGARPVQQIEHLHVVGLDKNGALTFLTGPQGREIVRQHLSSMPRFVGSLNGVHKGLR